MAQTRGVHGTVVGSVPGPTLAVVALALALLIVGIVLLIT